MASTADVVRRYFEVVGELEAELTAFITVREGLVFAPETFDCYVPTGGG